MYGFKSATRMALRRLRKPKGAPPFQPSLLLSSLDAGREFAAIDKAVSVIIPTKNTGTEFRHLLQRLRAQEGIGGCEVIVVDSGSTDDTVALARNEGAKVISIAPTEFTHASARNKGAEAASCDYVLFMVQDALPLGNLWLWEMLTSLQSNDLAAVSCAEYPRSDSDLFYQFLIYRQYDACGQNHDRILRWDDSCSSYLGLRSNAQLCDIAALVRRDLFAQYRFRTAYAEDLDLGIRLIRDGYKLGFLNSTRVLHSHNRSAYYFLKRGYVDVRFLTDVFPNFVYPEIDDEEQLYAEIVSLQDRLANITKTLAAQIYPLPVTTAMKLLRLHGELEADDSGAVDPDIRQLMQFLCSDSAAGGHPWPSNRSMVLPHVTKHLEEFGDWMSGIYTEVDRALAGEIAAAVDKILALHCGTHMAYLFRTRAARQRVGERLQQLDTRMTAGV
jgi:glycosyltransferase involved in cell wall biosynthesis